MKNIAIFASGGGSNAESIIHYMKGIDDINISLIISNKSKAGVLKRAYNHGIDAHLISRSSFYESKEILETLKEYNIDWIILAGFLWLVPAYLIDAYPERILNIHPALLPKYGGKGMYGMNVHKAVKENNEIVSGMTIHFVNQKYDEGKHVFQATTEINPEDSPEDIAAKVLKLEHKYYPQVIHHLVQSS
ncbi:MAG: phosphoribosylglycinamide formyltransferase [Saprospiraceae bacterium]|nr:phosphoribosylglycinamide formyltransferase [Saprospiraceae bacterium]